MSKIIENKDNTKIETPSLELKKARFTILLTTFIAIVVFLGVIYFGFVFPMAVSATLAEILAVHTLRWTYKILVMVCLVLWFTAMLSALAIPLLRLRKVDTLESDIVTMNNERIKPTTKKSKVKKIIIDILVSLGFAFFVTSQIILYAFIC